MAKKKKILLKILTWINDNPLSWLFIVIFIYLGKIIFEFINKVN